VCEQVCGQKNLAGLKASVSSDPSPMIFTNNSTSNSSSQHLKKFSVSIFLIRTYQVLLSPYLGGRCRFYPSCSHYAIESYQSFGFFKATSLVLKRILSCHPFTNKKNYYDPVPISLKGLL
jgi:putative membrane protein insertion efficiency factor